MIVLPQNIPKHSIILLGDFNCFNTDFVVSMINSNTTHGSTILDKMFVSEAVVKFVANVLEPLNYCNYNKILTSFGLPVKYLYQYREVYDYFSNLISKVNFNPMIKSQSLLLFKKLLLIN